MKRTVLCSFCSRNIDGKTWQRHMQRAHGLTQNETKQRAALTVIHIPLGMSNRRKLIHA